MQMPSLQCGLVGRGRPMCLGVTTQNHLLLFVLNSKQTYFFVPKFFCGVVAIYSRFPIFPCTIFTSHSLCHWHYISDTSSPSTVEQSGEHFLPCDRCRGRPGLQFAVMEVDVSCRPVSTCHPVQPDMCPRWVSCSELPLL